MIRIPLSGNRAPAFAGIPAHMGIRAHALLEKQGRPTPLLRW